MSVLDVRWMVPVSFNGNNINDWVDSTKSGTYRGLFPQGFPVENPVKPIYTERNDNVPVYSGQHITGRTFPIKIEIRGGSASAASTLMGWLDSLDVGGTYKLIVKNSGTAPFRGDNSQWYVYAKVIEAPKMEGAYSISFVVAVADPIWKNNSASTDTWTNPASGGNHNLTIGGNKFVRPKFTITPTGSRTNQFAYKKYLLVYNIVAGTSAYKYYLDVTSQTGKGWATNSLINNTSISNSINNVGGYNSSATTFAIDVAVGGGLPTGGGTCYCARTGEQFYYTSITGGNTMNGITRGYGGTTAASLNDDDVLVNSKLIANGNDVCLNIDGVNNFNIFFTGLNGATTGVHTALNFSAGISFSLNVAIASSGAITQIGVPKTATNLAYLKTLAGVPNQEVCIVSGGGTEIFLFTGVDLIGDASNYYLTGVTRHVYDDASNTFPMTSHAVADKVYWVEHAIWLMYGNPSLGTPDVDQTQKPLQDLTNSTNNSWVYSTYYDNTALRPGSWMPMILASLNQKSTSPSQTYTADASGGTDPNFANPATEMGVQFLAFNLNNVWKAETATIMWQLTHPFGMTSVKMSGKKYAVVTASFPKQCGLLKSNDGKTFTQVWNEAAPGSASTWTALSGGVNGVDKTLSGTYKTIRVGMTGSISAVASNESDLQTDTHTITLDSTLRPTVAAGAEQSNYTINMTFQNTSGSGDPANNWNFIIYVPHVFVNNYVVVDCDARTIKYFDNNNNLLQIIPSVAPNFTKSPARSEWMTLAPGTANITVTDAGLGNMTIKTDWNDRSV